MASVMTEIKASDLHESIRAEFGTKRDSRLIVTSSDHRINARELDDLNLAHFLYQMDTGQVPGVVWNGPAYCKWVAVFAAECMLEWKHRFGGFPPSTCFERLVLQISGMYPDLKEAAKHRRMVFSWSGAQPFTWHQVAESPNTSIVKHRPGKLQAECQRQCLPGLVWTNRTMPPWYYENLGLISKATDAYIKSKNYKVVC
jgi:hypothetical protein